LRYWQYQGDPWGRVDDLKLDNMNLQIIILFAENAKKALPGSAFFLNREHRRTI